MPSVAVFIAQGSEEIEAVSIIDVLRRAEIEVEVISVAPEGALQVTASRGVKLVADSHIEQLGEKAFDAWVLPGGLPGSECFRDSAELIALLQQRHSEQWLAAICAAPAVALVENQLLGSAQATCHPGFWEQLPAEQFSAARVVVDQGNRLLTSQGPGTALEFSLSLVELLTDRKTAQAVAAPMVLPEELAQQWS